MSDDIWEREEELKKNSNNSIEDFLKYIMFEMQCPIEDYYLVIDLLKDFYPKNRDIRLAILGAYLSSTWLYFQENSFLGYLDEHIAEADNQNKAIIYYLHAYDIYMKYDKKYPPEYSDFLRKSIACSERFVKNYVRLSEITNVREAYALLKQAILNVEKVLDIEQLRELPEDYFEDYNHFVEEFILGVNVDIYGYKELLAMRRTRWLKRKRK